LFDVKVDAVTVVNCRGKIKRHGVNWGRRVAWKKAYVRLAEGSQIDFLGTE
jgi:large subunit ribosomal protein L23